MHLEPERLLERLFAAAVEDRWRGRLSGKVFGPYSLRHSALNVALVRVVH